MLEERTISLINADLDGELSSADKAELDALLESSAEARTMKAELQRLNNLMDSLPPQSPPSGISEQVFDRLGLHGTPRFSLAGIFASLKPSPPALAFAAGLLMTVAIYELSPGGSSNADTASMVGTMVAGQTGAQSSLNNDIYLEGDGFTGTITLRNEAGLYVLNFDLDSEEKTWVKVGLDRTGLSFGGFAKLQEDSDEVFDAVAISGGTLRVVNDGHQQFAVFLRGSDSEQDIDPGSISIDFSRDMDSIREDAPGSQ